MNAQSDSKRRIIIVGAGPAGLAIAEYLISKGLEINIYDRGPSDVKSYSASGEYFGESFIPGGIGGAAIRWGGQLVRLNLSDYENWLKFDGVEKKFLDGIEIATEELLEKYSQEIPKFNEYKSAPVIDSRWRVTGSKVLLKKNLNEMFESTILSPKFHYHEGISAVCFQRSENDVVLSLSSGENLDINSHYIFLALGAIENASLLLRSSEFISELKSNELGCYLQDHPHGVVMNVRGFGGPFSAKRDLLKTPKFIDKKKFEYTSSTTDSRAAIFELHPKSFDKSLLDEIRSLIRFFTLKDFKKLCKRIASRAARFVLTREWRVQEVDVWIQYEQARNPKSRITATPEIRYEWRNSEEDLRFVNLFVKEIEKLLISFGLEVVSSVHFNTVTELDSWSSAACHPSGTIPLSSSAERGIANLSGLVHALPNTYVVGSGLFPTSGWFNPTLVIMAMARFSAKEFFQRHFNSN